MSFSYHLNKIDQEFIVVIHEGLEAKIENVTSVIKQHTHTY